MQRHLCPKLDSEWLRRHTDLPNFSIWLWTNSKGVPFPPIPSYPPSYPPPILPVSSQLQPYLLSKFFFSTQTPRRNFLHKFWIWCLHQAFIAAYHESAGIEIAFGNLNQVGYSLNQNPSPSPNPYCLKPPLAELANVPHTPPSPYFLHLKTIARDDEFFKLFASHYSKIYTVFRAS